MKEFKGMTKRVGRPYKDVFKGTEMKTKLIETKEPAKK